MEMDQRIPDLSDRELETLHANAIRLAQSGTPKQKQQAESLLPLLGETVEARRVTRAQAALERKRSTPKRKAKAIVAPADAQQEAPE